MSFSLFAQGVSMLLEFGQGNMNALANRQSAKAQMKALQEEKNWNIGVMERNAEDVFERSMLESWGAGIDPMTGSTAAVIASNEAVLRDEIGFRASQYDTQIKNLRAQSKQKYLGIFS